ncbi:MAG: hypothetical protein HY782_10730 [Chloroflexi bacterium]|nr:hypothetical protein [Chloroflexota bacterium]
MVLSTAIGLVATFAAPWMESQGTFQSWRIVEWRTFWRGDGAFQLADIVAPGYQVPVEYATTAMQSTAQNLFAIGTALGVWHGIALVILLASGARLRLRADVPRGRVAVEIALVVLVNAVALVALTVLLALPSSLSMKVDFRAPGDLHTDSLIWSNLTILPIAPVLSVLAALGQVIAAWRLAPNRRRSTVH